MLLIVALALGGCGGDVIDLPVSLVLEEGGCAGPEPGTAWLPCGGRIGVWLVSEQDEVLDEHCLPFTAEPRTIEDLPGLLEQVSFAGLRSGDRIELEIAIYSDDQLDTCARWDDGNPDGALPAYFGTSGLTELSESGPPLTVLLQCFEPILEPCEENWLQISATVANLETWEILDAEQSMLTVSAGTVSQEGTYQQGTMLEPQGTEWVGEFLSPPLPDQCTAVVVDDQEVGWPLLSCEAEMIELDLITASAYTLPGDTAQTILDLLGPEDPTMGGVGLGRIVNMANVPVEGAQILPSEPGLTIRYLSADMTSLNDPATAYHGYFVVTSETPGCCWSLGEVDPGGEALVYPFALVPEMLTVIPVRMEP
jgi:hypothetical protein